MLLGKVLWCKGPFDQRSFDFGGPLAKGPLEKVLCDKVLLLKVPLPQPRFISYMFVHLSYSHVLVNLCVQIFVGIPLEMSHGSIRVGFLYLAGVFAGSLTSSLAEPRINLAGNYFKN